MHFPLRQGKQMPTSNRLMSLRPAHPCRGSWKNEDSFSFSFFFILEMKTRILDLNLYLECAFRREGAAEAAPRHSLLLFFIGSWCKCLVWPGRKNGCWRLRGRFALSRRVLCGHVGISEAEILTFLWSRYHMYHRGRLLNEPVGEGAAGDAGSWLWETVG